MRGALSALTPPLVGWREKVVGVSPLLSPNAGREEGRNAHHLFPPTHEGWSEGRKSPPQGASPHLARGFQPRATAHDHISPFTNCRGPRPCAPGFELIFPLANCFWWVGGGRSPPPTHQKLLPCTGRERRYPTKARTRPPPIRVHPCPIPLPARQRRNPHRGAPGTAAPRGARYTTVRESPSWGGIEHRFPLLRKSSKRFPTPPNNRHSPHQGANFGQPVRPIRLFPSTYRLC